MAASKEAAARSATAIPPVSYGLTITEPAAKTSEATIPWLEIRGRAGTAELFEADLMIVMDLSMSTLFPSGVDLDEDGVTGELRRRVKSSSVEIGGGRGSIPGVGQSSEIDLGGAARRSGNAWQLHPRNWTTDRDDTIAEAQLAAARVLATGLGDRRNRLGLITYTSRARVRQELGSASDVLAAVDTLRITGGTPDTNLAAALRQARLHLTRAESDGERERAVLLFTDGRPNYPKDEYLARIQALYAADALAEEEIELYVFTFGEIGMSQARFLLELAGSVKGRLFRVMNPYRLLEDLPPLDLAPRWLEIENATTGADGRAVRTASDGRFEAFVPLEPGANRIRVMAELGDGRLQRWEHAVRYDPPEVETEDHRAATERVLEELRSREAAAERSLDPCGEGADC